MSRGLEVRERSVWTQEERAFRGEGIACTKVNGSKTSEAGVRKVEEIVGGDERRKRPDSGNHYKDPSFSPQ